MSIKYFIIIILLLIILYLYNKNKLIENLTETDSNAILETLASVYNKDTLQVKNIEITGTLKAPSIETTNLKTYKIDSSNKNKYIDMLGKTVFYDDVKIKNNKEFNSPIIKTNNISKVDGDYVKIDSNLYSPHDNLIGNIKPDTVNKKTNIIVNSDIEFNKANTLKVKNIYGHNIKPGYTDWINIDAKLDVSKTLQNKGKTIDYVWSGMSSKSDRGYVAYYPK